MKSKFWIQSNHVVCLSRLHKKLAYYKMVIDEIITEDRIMFKEQANKFQSIPDK